MSSTRISEKYLLMQLKVEQLRKVTHSLHIVHNSLLRKEQQIHFVRVCGSLVVECETLNCEVLGSNPLGRSCILVGARHIDTQNCIS